MEQIDTAVLQQLTAEQAWHFKVIPFENNSDSVQLYFDNSKNESSTARELSLILGKKIRLLPRDASEINEILIRYYHKSDSITEARLVDTKNFSSFLENLIIEAKEMESSDIHIEASKDSGRVRMRIDGYLRDKYSIGLSEYPSLINRIKVFANLDISEKRLPQDGRISFSADLHNFDLRVSTLPTIHGEKVVMRILSSDASNLDIRKLGLTDQDFGIYASAIGKSNGIILVSGPTGSGKTTTLYATLKELNVIGKNIITIEDPIEYTLAGINQVQVKENIGLTFSKVLRTVLRQDPDIIMIGEIRDKETAELAVRSALTGHLVLSTIHTNSAASTIDRLIDLGVPKYLIVNTLSVSLAQRLVRKLCVECKVERMVTIDDRLTDTRISMPLQFPIGCAECQFSGYSGRMAIYEVIELNKSNKEYIIQSPSSSDIYNDQKIPTLASSAERLLFDGETSFDEVSPYLNNISIIQ